MQNTWAFDEDMGASNFRTFFRQKQLTYLIFNGTLLSPKNCKPLSIIFPTKGYLLKITFTFVTILQLNSPSQKFIFERTE